MRRLNLRTTLTVLAVVLAFWLVLGFWSLKTVNSFAVCAVAVLTAATMLWSQRRPPGDENSFADSMLPPQGYRAAVVLVCGDSSPLSGGQVYRETRQGWYLFVTDAEQLSGLGARLYRYRPDLLPQLSLLMAVIPERHTSAEGLSQRQQNWQRAMKQCRGALHRQVPYWTVTWASAYDAGTDWFCVMPELADVQVCPAGNVSLPLADWFTQGAEHLHRALRLQSLMMWDAHHDHGAPGIQPCRAGFCLTPVSAIAGNLWQQHATALTTLSADAGTQSGELPLPDPLLADLPTGPGISRAMRTARLGAAIVMLFIALALTASFVNNQRLLRSIDDHLVLWRNLPDDAIAAKSLAREQLIEDRTILDAWQRSGEPLRLGLGLYQGMRLSPVVNAAIHRWAPPSAPAPVIQQITEGPQSVSLDSLSLFDSGKSALKSGSDKVLINALVGIKAKPGWLIVVSGHTDSTGKPEFNQRLSQQRAEAVRNWMRDTGDVPESCFAVQGYGDSRPMATNDTPEGRGINRRVEISLVPQVDACQVPDITPSSSRDGDGIQHKMEY